MAHGPLVSIVLPTFNGSRYLGESVRSCIAQTYPNWELILVDDASTDSTPRLIAEFVAQDARIRSLRNDPNRRLPASLNRGFKESRGEYLTWTSDDNYYAPEALSKMVSVLQKNPTTDFVYADYQTIDDDGKITGKKSVLEIEELWAGNTIGACFLYKRLVQERLSGYAENLFLAEDYDFWLRASVEFKFQPLHESLYFYRYHSASLTSAQSDKTAALADLALAKNIRNLHWMSRDLKIEAALRLIKGALKRRNFADAAAWAEYAFELSPSLAASTLIKKLFRAFK